MEDVAAKLNRISKHRKEVEETARTLRYQDQSRARLLRILRKKFQTTFIGGLSRFETHFGSLWGQNKPDHERTPDEQAWFEIWQACRTDILNNGNSQLRAVEQEVSQYTMSWDRYQVELPVTQQEP